MKIFILFSILFCSNITFSNGLLPQDLVSNFPAVGKTYESDLGEDMKFKIEFISDKRAKFTSLTEPNISEEVDINVTELRPKIFIVTWKEKSGTTVVHIEDFGRKSVHLSMTTPEGEFINKKGSFKKVK